MNKFGKNSIRLGFLSLCISALPAFSQIFGTVRVVVRDPQNLAVVNAQVVVRAKNSEWMQTAKSNGEGIALIPAVPIGRRAEPSSVWLDQIPHHDGYWNVLRHVEIHLIRSALAEAHGNKAEAARILGVRRRLLYEKLSELGLS